MNRKTVNKGLPKIASWFLKRSLPVDDRQYLLGDFEETYINIKTEKNQLCAWLWFWKLVLCSVPLFLEHNNNIRVMMYKNYLRIALRNIFKQKLYSLINIWGLAIGMACTLMIFLWINDELGYDSFHENGNDIYRVLEDVYFTETSVKGYTTIPRRLAPALCEHYPEVTDFTRFLPGKNVVVSYGNRIFNENYLANVDPSFLSIFSFDLSSGEPETALLDPNSIVITKNIAEKYFGETDPLNKILRLENQYDLKVTGVLENIPSNSHLKFDFLVPFVENRWIGLPEGTPPLVYSYVMLLNRIDHSVFNGKIRNFFSKVYNDDIRVDMYLQSLADIHLYSKKDNVGLLEETGDITYVYLFSIIALFILLVACINFINLSTAKAAVRAREVGIRKVVGAHRKDVIRQFFTESLVMTLVSFITAIVFVITAIPAFNKITQKELALLDLLSPGSLIGALILILITGIFAGSYPAVYLSSFQPARVIKGLFYRKERNGFSIRSILIVFQFAVSITLILATLIIEDQVEFIRNNNPGYIKDHTIYVPLKNGLKDNYRSIRNELLQHPEIISVSACSEPPVNITRTSDRFTWEGREITENNANRSELIAYLLFVDQNSLGSFGMNIIEGRDFNLEFATDFDRAFIVNETAAKGMGYNSAVGKTLELWGWEGKIIGVVEDFHYRSLHNELEPLIIKLDHERLRYMFIKFSPGANELDKIVSILENKWDDYALNSPFVYNFLDDTYTYLYKKERRLSRLFNYFTLIAVTISCIGLFGLSSFITYKRSKEIGVRKVLGAKISGLFIILTADFQKWVVTANLIAVPAALLFKEKWLQNFAYKASTGIEVFITATLLVIGISLFSICFQSLQAVFKNPVNTLRSE